jgi:hypothetical protein
MIWAKRRFEYAEFAPYQDRLDKLILKHPAMHDQFVMVSVEVKKPRLSDYYIGLPTEALLPLFDGFELVAESELPKEIDAILVASLTPEFENRFHLRAT